MKLPDGIYTVVVTPFDDRGQINLPVLRDHVEWLIGQGVHVMIPGGTTGEYYAQTTEERISVLEVVADVVGGRVPLLAGTNSIRPDETLFLSARARDLGYQGLMLAAPYYALPTEDELVAHFRRIAETIELPILLYNFPARTGVDMTPSFLRKATQIESIVGIKESSGSIARLHELVTEFADSLETVCGADDQALEYFLWGSRNWVAGASNFLPAAHVRLFELCVEQQDFVAGRELARRLVPLFTLLERGGKYIQYVKYGTELAGYPVGTVRPPILPLTDHEKEEFRGQLESVADLGAPLVSVPV